MLSGAGIASSKQVSTPPQYHLDDVLDDVKTLGKIADNMYEWEGPVADCLELTPTDVAGIKCKQPHNLNLQA